MIALLWLLTQDTGRAWTQPLPMSDVRDEVLLEEVRAFEFSGPFDWSMKRVRATKRYEKFEVTFPSPVKTDVEANNTVHAIYYRPVGEGPFPALVVLHWLGGSYGILQAFCSRLAESDVAALFVWMPYYGPRRGDSDRRLVSLDMDATVAGVQQAVKDVRRAAHWLRSRGDVERVGLMGVSLGAIVGATAAGVDPSFDAFISVIGAGDVASILTHPSRETRGVPEEMARRGLTEASLREAIKGVVPSTFAHRIPRERVLMINAKHDEIIPRESTDALYDAIGKPEIRWYEGGHYTIALHIEALYWDVLTWMRPVRWH